MALERDQPKQQPAFLTADEAQPDRQEFGQTHACQGGFQFRIGIITDKSWLPGRERLPVGK